MSIEREHVVTEPMAAANVYYVTAPALPARVLYDPEEDR